MRMKRFYLPINKVKIQEAIDLYNEYRDKVDSVSGEESTAIWEKYCDTCHEICPNSNVWAMSIMQSMCWSGTLTVDRVYNTILASGTNTVLREVYDYDDEL